MIGDPELGELVDELARARAEHIAEIAPQDADHVVVAWAAFCVGFQTALELSQLDPKVARATIRVIHERQPECIEEHNRNALIFIERARQ